MTDIIQRLRCTVPCADMTAKAGCHCAEARDEILRLRAMVTPKPLDGTEPRDRALIGVDRPPFEDKTYYYIIQWREDQQEWMVEAGIDWSVSPGKIIWAHCGVSHYLDPLELPGLPYWEGEDEDGDDVEQ